MSPAQRCRHRRHGPDARQRSRRPCAEAARWSCGNRCKSASASLQAQRMPGGCATRLRAPQGPQPMPGGGIDVGKVRTSSRPRSSLARGAKQPRSELPGEVHPWRIEQHIAGKQCSGAVLEKCPARRWLYHALLSRQIHRVCPSSPATDQWPFNSDNSRGHLTRTIAEAARPSLYLYEQFFPRIIVARQPTVRSDPCPPR